jgi:pimeloyl-[acyl-carrier protein] methyl ester esterase
MSGVYAQTIGAIGAGKPLALVHGWAMHSGVWGGFAVELAKHCKLILVDLPGHGRSEPARPFSLPTIAAQLVAAVADEHCSWLGWSLGAQVVLQIAADFPERVDKLILLAGTPCFVAKSDWPGMKENVLDKFAELLQLEGEDTLLKFLSLQVKDIDTAKSVLTSLRAALASTPLPDQLTLQEGLQILKNADLRQEMATIKQPMCAILGGLDTLVSPKTGVAMQQLLPSMQLHRIERAGHTPFLSHSGQVVELIRRFTGV